MKSAAAERKQQDNCEENDEHSLLFYRAGSLGRNSLSAQPG